ncbi:MAG TPA: response regulator [Thermoanaerobaculia bacterium]|nr:response regulator [Thermoanaerobaculia bacterium]
MLSLLNRKTRVLVLDDDPSMQRLIAALLRKHGYRVDVVSNGSQAIDHLKRIDYAALLLDLMTPTEGGMTVIRHLRTANAKLLDRVILVTASPDTILKAIEGDVAAVVHKPFEQQELIAAVNRVVTAVS